MGLYTPTILGGNSYLSWFYDRGAIKDPAHTGTSKGLSQALNRGPIRKFLPKYANVYVTIQSHGLSAGVRTHYVTAYGVRNRLVQFPGSNQSAVTLIKFWSSQIPGILFMFSLLYLLCVLPVVMCVEAHLILRPAYNLECNNLIT